MDLNQTPNPGSNPDTDANEAKLEGAVARLGSCVNSVYGDLAAPDMERSFLQALQRQPVSCAGRYQVYTDFSKADETVVLVHDATGGSDHKYIFAKTPDHTYIVAAPIEWTS